MVKPITTIITPNKKNTSHDCFPYFFINLSINIILTIEHRKQVPAYMDAQNKGIVPDTIKVIVRADEVNNIVVAFTTATVLGLKPNDINTGPIIIPPPIPMIPEIIPVINVIMDMVSLFLMVN